MKNKFLIGILAVSLFSSCGYSTLDSQEDAKKFLESNNFYDDNATITGRGGGALKSGFSIQFVNGNAIIGDETMPYSISGPTENVNSATYAANRIKGYEIKFCGSERYAYGGCIICYLDCGEGREYGPSLSVKGEYLDAYFSNITEGAIIKK